MSDQDQYAPYPDMSEVLTQRIQQRIAATANPPVGSVDPYKLMLQKKTTETQPQNPDPKSIVKWPDEDVKQLEDYCAKMGIVGFNSGRMSPIAALALLKQQFGDYSNVPLGDRIPEGYEKMGTHSPYSPGHPYSPSTPKKQVLYG